MIDLSVPPLDYFTKRAKELRDSVQAGNAVALGRVRSVFNDAAGGSDPEVIAGSGLMRAQHVIAVEHGFDSWTALTESSGIEARLALTMARVPELNDFGIGIYGGHKDKSHEEKIAIVAKTRKELRQSVTAVTTTVEWLRENIEPTRTVNHKHTSYGIKHVAEKDIGYITNGVFIAAGIIAGYPYVIVPGSPNVPFGISEKSLKGVYTRRTSPDHVLKRFVARAIEILAKRGIQALPAAGGRRGAELVWREDGDVRTLRIGAYSTTPFIVRLYVDHFAFFVSRKVAKALGVGGDHYTEVAPVRPKGEFSILLDEVDTVLEWALNFDARTGSPPPPPFETRSGRWNWDYMWSKRADARYEVVVRRAAPASPTVTQS